nr:uncharacterized protein LOC106685029 isoform X1 [Halyomorpha halys]
MWRYVLLLGLLAVAASERHKRLTTFGKAPDKPTQATGKGKECKTDKDCLSQTVCKEEKDGKMRCSCEDGTLPVNGHCLHTREKRGYVPKGHSQVLKGLGKPCSANNECIHGAECKINPNSTQKYRVCMCEEDMIEEAGQCSGCGNINFQGWILTGMGSLLLRWLHH